MSSSAFIFSLCTRFSEDADLLAAGGRHLGCYRDNLGIRILKGFVRLDWELNSPELCTRMCSRAGFAFSGVQFGVECYCGHDAPVEKHRFGNVENRELYNLSWLGLVQITARWNVLLGRISVEENWP